MLPRDHISARPEDDSRDYGYNKNFRTALPQLIAVSIKNLLLLAYGMTLGFVTILIPAVSDPSNTDEVIHLNKTEISWIGSLNLIVVPLGCALSGLVTNPLGRRRSMQLVNIPFILAWLLLYNARTSDYLYVALGLTGLSGGILEAPVLTYVAEVTQPHLRGFLAASSSMTIIIGVFTQFLFGLLFHWRTITLINTAFTIASTIALFFIPESPHWLVSKSRYTEATQSLQWLRGWTTSEQVQEELTDIKKLYCDKIGTSDVKIQETILESLAHYTKSGFIRPYILVSYAFFVGHFSGMTTLQTYAVSIFNGLAAYIDSYVATFILGVVQIAGSLMCVVLVHFTGKRPLTLLSLAGIALCCLIVSGCDMFAWNMEYGYSWIPMTSFMMLAFLSHMGIRLLPWMLIGEVFSARTRSGASGLSSATGYIFAFLSNKYFTSMLDTLKISGTYGFYALMSITGAVIFYIILPETEGKKLIDIENHFAGVKKLDNGVNGVRKSEGRIIMPSASKPADIIEMENKIIAAPYLNTQVDEQPATNDSKPDKYYDNCAFVNEPTSQDQKVKISLQ